MKEAKESDFLSREKMVVGHFSTTQKQILIVHLQFLVYKPGSNQPKNTWLC